MARAAPLRLFAGFNFNQLLSLGVAAAGGIVTIVLAIWFKATTPTFVSLALTVALTMLSDRAARYMFENNLQESLSRIALKSGDLQYIGSAKAGVEWFCRNYHGVLRVKNTVFNRSDDYHFPQMTAVREKFIQSAITAMETCYWTDLYSTGEKDSISSFAAVIPEKLRYRYNAFELDTGRAVPMMQCLIMDFDDNVSKVLFGWGFPGEDHSRVYLSEDAETAAYFDAYFDGLKAAARQTWSRAVPVEAEAGLTVS